MFLTAYFITTVMEQLRTEERQALDDRRRLEQVFKSTGAGVLIMDEKRQVLWYNDQLRDWLSLPVSRFHEATDVLRNWAAKTEDAATIPLGSGEARVTSRILETRPAENRYFQVTAGPFLIEDGHVSQIVELYQDITEQRRTQALLMQVGKMAALGEMAGQIAHEINNPVGIISGKCRILLSNHAGEFTGKVASELKKITDLSDRLGGIVQSWLTHCRPSSGAQTPLNVHAPLRRAVDLVQHMATEADVRIDYGPTEISPHVRANANELEQLFLNLFKNAIDAMPQGGILSISASLPAEDDAAPDTACISICVRDTGTGIAPEIRDKILDPFFTTKDEGRGTGLGLAICYDIVRGHGGTLEIMSELGKGTLVTIKLPVAGADRGESQDA